LHSGIGYLTPERKAELAAAAQAVTVSVQAEQAHLRHRMPTVDFVRGSPVPTALIMAGRDAIVPARRSMALRAAIGNLVFEAVVDAGHNDLYGRSTYAAAMREALARIEAASGAAPGR
jgi:hypothetical protein